MLYLLAFFIVRSESLMVSLPDGSIRGYQMLLSSGKEVCLFRNMQYHGENEVFRRLYSGRELFLFFPGGDSLIRMDMETGKRSVIMWGSVSSKFNIEGKEERFDSVKTVILSDSCRRFTAYRVNDGSVDSTVIRICYLEGKNPLLKMEEKYISSFPGMNSGLALGFIRTPASGLLSIIPVSGKGRGIPVYVEGSSYIGGIRILHFGARLIDVIKSDAKSCMEILR